MDAVFPCNQGCVSPVLHVLLDGAAASPGNTARWVVHDAVPDQHRYPATTASGARFEDRASSPIGARDRREFPGRNRFGASSRRGIVLPSPRAAEGGDAELPTGNRRPAAVVTWLPAAVPGVT
jgi:hypothetical protein